jgi:glutaredoxin
MKQNLTFFYTDECPKCKELKPVMEELQQVFDITYVNTHEDELLTESNGVEFVPTIIIENQLGEHKMIGNNEIAKFLHEILSGPKTN